MKWPWRKPKKLNETTRLYALYGENANLEYLDNQDKQTIQRVEVVENNLQQTNQNLNQTNQNLTQTNNKVDNLENRLNNLPSIDTSNLGKLDKENTWEKPQTFKRASIGSGFMTNLFITNRGTVDTVGSDENAIVNKRYVDGELNRTAKLSGAPLQRWTTENIFETNTGFGGRINMNSNKIINLATPASSTDAANKAYVDSGLNNAAKLSGVSDQRWSSGNIFDGNTGFGSRINMNGNRIINLATPTSSTDAATKGYVDTLKKNMFGSTWESVANYLDGSYRVWKSDLLKGLYQYVIFITRDDMRKVIEGRVGRVAGRKFLVQIETISCGAKNNSQVSYLNFYKPITRIFEFGNVQIHTELNYDIVCEKVSSVDLNIGTSGEFWTTLAFEMKITEILL